MNARIRAWVALGAAVLLVGCSHAAKLETMESPQSAMVFGSVTADEPIRNVRMLEFGKVYVTFASEPPKPQLLNNGMFDFENVPPGRYYVESIASAHNLYSFAPTADTDIDQFKQEHLFTVKPGELYYLGSFRIKITKNAGTFSSGEMSLQRVKSPSEKDILKRMLRIGKGSGWEPRIQARIDQLK